MEKMRNSRKIVEMWNKRLFCPVAKPRFIEISSPLFWILYSFLFSIFFFFVTSCYNAWEGDYVQRTYSFVAYATSTTNKCIHNSHSLTHNSCHLDAIVDFKWKFCEWVESGSERSKKNNYLQKKKESKLIYLILQQLHFDRRTFKSRHKIRFLFIFML